MDSFGPYGTAHHTVAMVYSEVLVWKAMFVSTATEKRNLTCVVQVRRQRAPWILGDTPI
jgi:hypothetical protein